MIGKERFKKLTEIEHSLTKLVKKGWVVEHVGYIDSETEGFKVIIALRPSSHEKGILCT